MQMKKIVLICISIIIIIGIIVGVCLGCYFKIGVKPAAIETIKVGDGTSIRVGIISDTQLPPKKSGAKTYREHLEKALTVLKEQKVEMIVHAGDIGDNNNNYSYETYNEVYEKVMGNDSGIETLYIMGNHDLWWPNNHGSIAPKQRKFTSHIGQSPFVHKVVNGFHFIGVSPDQGSSIDAYSQNAVDWMDEQIKLAQHDTPDMPIFVITHQNPKNTTYGSDDWHDLTIDNTLNKYSNVVSISGHSHYSILDERSIYQNNYTAFTTQSLAYIENEEGKFDPFKNKNSSTPPRDSDKPMMLIMNVSQNGTTIERWNVEENLEEKANMRWTLNYPLNKDSFTYSTAQKEVLNTAPSMALSKTVEYNPAVESTLYEVTKGEETLQGISFGAGTDNDFVHSYKIVLRGQSECEYTYFSDFYNGICNMAQTVNFALDKTLPAGDYTIRVYAIDSLGLVSEDFAQGNITLK